MTDRKSLKMMSPRRHTHSTTLTDEQVNSYKPEESAYLESTIGVTSLSGDTRDKVRLMEYRLISFRMDQLSRDDNAVICHIHKFHVSDDVYPLFDNF